MLQYSDLLTLLNIHELKYQGWNPDSSEIITAVVRLSSLTRLHTAVQSETRLNRGRLVSSGNAGCSLRLLHYEPVSDSEQSWDTK